MAEHILRLHGNCGHSADHQSQRVRGQLRHRLHNRLRSCRDVRVSVSRTLRVQCSTGTRRFVPGTSIHETVQVAGAGLMYGAQYDAPAALDIATITKLVRNLCMIAVIPMVTMAAVGLTSMFAGIARIGFRTFALRLFAAVFIGGVSFAFIAMLGPAFIESLT